MPPSISVLIPIFNGEKFLQESLDSLYNQTFQDFEIIIVDDGSTDRTFDIIQTQQTDKIKYYKNEQNFGIIVTLNKGLQYCTGKYIARMDADDISFPERLEKQWSFMETHPQCVLCGTSINKFSENYSFLDYRGGDNARIKAKLVFDTAINHPSAIMRNAIIKDNNLSYPFDFPHAEDYGFWYQLSQYGEIANLNEILVKYRMHGDNVSMKFNQVQYESMNKVRTRILQDFWKGYGEKGIEWMEHFKSLIAKSPITLQDMKAMDGLLMGFIRQNDKTATYDKAALASNAAWFWYVVYVHENCFKFNIKMLQFVFGKKSIAKYLDWSYKKKLLIKSILFLKKK